MKRTESSRIRRIKSGNELGTRAVWGKVGYEGAEFAPVVGTYEMARPDKVPFTTVADSGICSSERVPFANLAPLVAAALYETGFAYEAGPLSTWSN